MAGRKLLKDVDPLAFDTMPGFEKYLAASSGGHCNERMEPRWNYYRP